MFEKIKTDLKEIKQNDTQIFKYVVVEQMTDKSYGVYSNNGNNQRATCDPLMVARFRAIAIKKARFLEYAYYICESVENWFINTFDVVREYLRGEPNMDWIHKIRLPWTKNK